MIHDKAVIQQAMADALTEGAERVPTRLLALLEAEADPLAALNDGDKVGAFYQAVQQDVGFSMDLTTGTQIAADQTVKLAAVFRWLLRQVQEWSPTQDVKRSTLLAMFILAQYTDHGTTLWSALPAHVVASRALLDVLEELFGKSSITYGTRGGVAAPIWETEAVAALQVADAEGDWEVLEDLAFKIRDSVFPSLPVSQATQILNRFDHPRLVPATAGVKQLAMTMQVFRSLNSEDQLRLGAASANPHMQFGVVYETTTPRTSRTLGVAERASLVAVFRKVADEPKRWEEWMRAFNRFPMRYVPIQEALGEALASVPDAAVLAYVDAIVLTPHPDNQRSPVDNSLRAFQATASLARRQLLWNAAHTRWRAWAFDAAFPERHIFSVQRSDLDFAVVGFGIECLSQEETKQAVNQVLLAMQQIEVKWHESITSHSTECNRHLSLLQPLAHAASVRADGGDWVRGGRHYLPFAPGTNPYLERMRGMEATAGLKGGQI